MGNFCMIFIRFYVIYSLIFIFVEGRGARAVTVMDIDGFLESFLVTQIRRQKRTDAEVEVPMLMSPLSCSRRVLVGYNSDVQD